MLLLLQICCLQMTVFFFTASNEEAYVVKNLLNSYELISGQAIDYQKSRVFYSSNVKRDKQCEISGILRVWNDLTQSKYLGLLSLIGRSKTSIFKFVKDKVWKKLQSWNVKLLSRVGKAVLIKRVA